MADPPRKRMAPLLAGLMAAAAGSLLAAEGAQAGKLPPSAAAWVREMHRTCADFDNGKLQIDWKAFLHKEDITGDGIPDLVMHATPDAVSCTTLATPYCGTGGCGLMIVVNGRRAFRFLAHSWEVGRLADGRAILSLSVHWSECDHKPACRRLYVWERKTRRWRDFGKVWGYREPQ